MQENEVGDLNTKMQEEIQKLFNTNFDTTDEAKTIELIKNIQNLFIKEQTHNADGQKTNLIGVDANPLHNFNIVKSKAKRSYLNFRKQRAKMIYKALKAEALQNEDQKLTYDSLDNIINNDHSAFQTVKNFCQKCKLHISKFFDTAALKRVDDFRHLDATEDRIRATKYYISNKILQTEKKLEALRSQRSQKAARGFATRLKRLKNANQDVPGI